MKVVKIIFFTCICLSLPLNASEMQQKQLIRNRTAQALYAFSLPSSRRDLDKIRNLIAEGIDVDQTDMAYQKLIDYAVGYGYADIVQSLLIAGAKPTASIYGKAYTKPDIVQILINAGIPVNPINKYVHTSLMLAAQYGNIEVVKLLLAAGADVNAQNKCHETALILSLNNKPNVEMAKLLIKAGANVNLSGWRGSTALTYALAHNNMELVKLLRKEGAQPTNQDFLAALKTNNPTQFLLELLNPYLTSETKEKIKTVLLIHRRPETSISVLPKDLIKVILGYIFPEYIQKMGLSQEELRNVESKTLIDRLPFEQLAQAIKAGIVDKKFALKQWQEKVDALHKQLSSKYSVNQQGLQKLKTEVPKEIEELLQ